MNYEPNDRPKPKLKSKQNVQPDDALEVTPETELEITPQARMEIELQARLETQPDAEVNAVDFLIRGKPTQFQLDLLQLGRKLHWDENDPGFAVPLSMGQIKHVLDIYPARIKVDSSKQST